MTREGSTEDNNIKNIAKEIVKNCAQLGMVVSHDLASYMVRLKMLDPANGFTADRVMSRNLIQILVDRLVAELSQDSLNVNTIRLQVYWTSNDIDRAKVAEDYHKVVYNRALPILKEIVESSAHSKEETEQLYKRIVIFTVLYSGLGNPTSQPVLREASPALHSVFKSSDLETFIHLSRKEREHQLIEFTRIVTGIRLFNKDCQKGGEGIDDLPVILVQAVQATRDRIGNTLEHIAERLMRLEFVLENAMRLNAARERPVDTEIQYYLPMGYRKEHVEEVKAVVTIMRQHEVCLRKLSEELELSNAAVLDFIDQLQKTLVKLHDVVRYRAAVPTVQVYPLFIELSSIWVKLQDETANLSHINTVLVNLNSVNKYFDPLPLEVALNLPSISSDIATPPKITRGGDFHPDVTVVSSSDPIFNQIIPEFRGYCVWTFAQAEGTIVPGRKDIGYLGYQRRCYAFSTPTVAYKWAANPDLYLLRVYNVARTKTELVHLLNIHDTLMEVKTQDLSVAQKQVIATQNAEVQTETHPVPSFIDKDYTFSEWQLKKRAVALTNMANRLTKSQQTVSHSHFRADAIIQVEKKMCVETQTRRDNFCNHPTLRNFVWGLRGRTDDAAHVVTVARPLDEELTCGSLTAKTKKIQSKSKKSPTKSKPGGDRLTKSNKRGLLPEPSKI